MPQSPDDQLAIVLGQRQLIAVCCMFLAVMSLVGTLAYVCGRSITAAQMRAEMKQEPVTAIVVDPVRSSAESIPGVMVAQAQNVIIPTPKPAPVLDAPKPTKAPPVNDVEPKRGQSFYQVGMVDRGMASVIAEMLTKQGLEVQISSGDKPTERRVLVGPLMTQAETDRSKRVLDQDGFQAFLRRY